MTVTRTTCYNRGARIRLQKLGPNNLYEDYIKSRVDYGRQSQIEQNGAACAYKFYFFFENDIHY